MGKRGEPMLHFFMILNEIVMKLIRLVMWYVQKELFQERERITFQSFFVGIHQLVSCF